MTDPSLRNGIGVNPASSKKRKITNICEQINPESKKATKEDRREAKRLRKLEKEESNGLRVQIALDHRNTIEDRDSKAVEKARKGKGEKRILKAEKRAVVQQATEPSKEKEYTNGTAHGDTTKDHIGRDSEKKAAKEIRRQEKARRKAERGAKSHEGQNHTHQTPSAVVKSSTQEVEIAEAHHAPPLGYTENPLLSALPQVAIDSFLGTNHITVIDSSTQKSPSCRPITDFGYLPPDTRSSKAEYSPFASFKFPTPIQAAAWPHLLSGRDVIGVAETGSGKTLAFGVPCIRCINALEPSPNPSPARAVIVSPTRELAVQIHTQLETLAAPASLNTVCVYGGVPKDAQREALKTANIIVATPGRLNDLIEEGAADLGYVKYLVLDEADRMLDKGFEDAIRTIISKTPPSSSGRQTSMFTATWPPSVRELAATFMTQPIHITIGANNPKGELRANKSITQVVEVIDPSFKEGRLRELIKQHSGPTYPNTTKSQSSNKSPNSRYRILVFCLYKKEVARIETMLRKSIGSYLKIAGIHGDMSQHLRSASLDAFRSGTVSILVATDVAARGLDIPHVKLVVNVTFPLTVEDYVHRIGRTGRAGTDGLAITLFTEHDKALAGGLVNVLKAAGQDVPEDLLRFGTTVKKKGHEAYGNFYREPKEGEKKEGTMIRF
ncbi:MAG: hypothetical protein Q9217_002322 [Psora testacea]